MRSFANQGVTQFRYSTATTDFAPDKITWSSRLTPAAAKAGATARATAPSLMQGRGNSTSRADHPARLAGSRCQIEHWRAQGARLSRRHAYGPWR